jgi:segregation and condensation protein A
MGVTVTFLALLELVREALVEIIQAESYGPIHVRARSQHGEQNSQLPESTEEQRENE